MYRSTKRLLIAALFSALGFAGTHYWYVTNSISSTNYGDKKPIARLADLRNDVQRKAAQRLIWNPISENEDLYSGEAIRTSEDSEAKIELLSGTSIELEPDSVVVIEETAGKMALDFVKGNMMVTAVGTSADALTLKSGDKTVTVNNGELSLGKDKAGSLEVQVVKGNAQVSQNGKQTQLSLNSNQVNKINVTKPSLGESLYINPEQREMVFIEWKKLSAEYDITIEVGTKRNELRPVSNLTVTGDKGLLEAPLKIGSQFWRLVATSKNPQLLPIYSSVFKNKVFAKTPPVPLEPISDETVTFNPGEKDVAFLWANPASLSPLILEVASDPLFKQKIITLQPENTGSVKAPLTRSGKYFWRISGFIKGNKGAISSPVQTFQLKTVRETETPQLNRPLVNERISYKTFAQNGLSFQWKTVSGVDNYKFYLAPVVEPGRKIDSVSPSIEQDLTFSTFKASQLKPGKYTWHVTAIGKDGLVSKPSEKRLFTLEDTPILNWADNQVFGEYFYTTENPTLGLSWANGPQGAKSWQVRVYEKGSEIPMTQWQPVAKPFALLPVPKDTEYEAEAEALDENKNVLARSLRRVVNVKVYPGLPAPLYAEGLSVPIQASGSGAAQIAWRPVDGAKEYQAVIKDSKGEVLKQIKFIGAQGQLSALMPGSYKVSLRTVDQRGFIGKPGEEREIVVPNFSGIKAPKLKKVNIK